MVLYHHASCSWWSVFIHRHRGWLARICSWCKGSCKLPVISDSDKWRITGVQDCGKDKGIMCMWDETMASRGSQEIGSCLLKFLQSRTSSASHLVCYSNSCGGQNRNINMARFWLHVVAWDNYSYTTVDHKFMVSGHSYLPNDRDFSNIENAMRKSQVIYVPSDWYHLVSECLWNNTFEVIEMKVDDFRSIAPVKSSITNRKTTVNNEKVEWMQMRWLWFQKAHRFSMQFRYTHNKLDEWKVVDVKKRVKGRPPGLGRLSLPWLWEDSRCLDSKKLTDLTSLLYYIPPIYHAFYTNLSASGADEESDNTESENEQWHWSCAV